MRIRIINDPQTAMANVLAGEVHFVTNFTFSVDQGQVLVSKRMGGANREIARLMEGQFFGEMALLTGERRSA